jgi:HAD superfamily hydrolase (TIGR01509 family)
VREALRSRSRWVFDLDGTLTVAVHDFEAIRAELGLPSGQPILEALAALDPADAARRTLRLDEIEADLARRARPAKGAAALLDALARRDAGLGIVTRNSHANALATLRAAGLARWFPPACVLGREAAAPKPSPEGLLRLLAAWRAAPSDAVMVGDSRQDLVAGRAAGVATVHVDRERRFRASEHADLCVDSLAALADLIADS